MCILTIVYHFKFADNQKVDSKTQGKCKCHILIFYTWALMYDEDITRRDG
jgi:hypothetical protein